MLRSIVNVMKNSGMTLPEWLSEIKKITPAEQRELIYNPPEREAICDIPEEKSAQQTEPQKNFTQKRNRPQK